MSVVRLVPILTVLIILHTHSVASDFLSPFLDQLCSVVNICGKGECVLLDNSTFGFECQCDQGWRQTLSGDANNLTFLPCVIPNCSLDYSCDPPPPSPPRNLSGTNSSIFDPCFWADCRGGSCKDETPFIPTCVCDAGYHNLLNLTSFPCYKQCEIGVDCSNLGITIANGSNSGTPPSTNMAGTSFIPRLEISWSVAILIFGIHFYSLY